jgi:hypothetical protein
VRHATQKAGEEGTDPDMQHVAAAAADGSSGQDLQVEACEGVQRMAKVGVPLQKTAQADICTHKTAQDDIHKNIHTTNYTLVKR